MKTGLALLLCCVLLPASARTTGPGTQEWNFTVLLDEKPIGSHRFTVSGPPSARTVRSEAAFDVKLLGLTVYRYRHEADESWRGDCLATLQARTDDGGEQSAVRATSVAEGLAVEASGAVQVLPGCVMGFAYWNPSMRDQRQLLNVQTGSMENVRIREAGEGTVPVAGTAQPARRWRIEGPAQPITLWYSPEGRWLGLDAEIRGGRQLRYRLR